MIPNSHLFVRAVIIMMIVSVKAGNQKRLSGFCVREAVFSFIDISVRR